MGSQKSVVVIALLFASYLLCVPAPVSADKPAALGQDLGPLMQCIAGDRDSFLITADVHVKIDGKLQHLEGRLVRYDDQQFDLAITHADYAVDLRRRAGQTALALPRHGTVFVGSGPVDAEDHLAPREAMNRLVSSGSIVSIYSLLIQSGSTSNLLNAVRGFANLKYDDGANQWKVGDDGTIQFSESGNTIQWNMGDSRGTLKIGQPESIATTDWPEFKRVTIEREELERQLVRGIRRALEILAPSPMLKNPGQVARKVPHGELRFQGRQRVALLWGTPEQIGRAHGQLLAKEANRCIDSVLYAFGTIQTIRTGRWFRDDLDKAYARLSTHIPEDHKVETRALATALAMDTDLIESLNVFPELFHCSGFAVFGEATMDGKLYHGRVLDYMTTIGLQDAATTFIIAVDGKIPFANVGYAGFIGSVTGMNDASISLGEMGGGGEGQWDGVPMATLMRRALEECSTLEDVKQLWQTSPRTCEYFYVFADGKTNEAVGVAALPESIEFIDPGQAHERLGPGIEDAVVLSAGDRLKTLRQRVQERHGQIDVENAIWLMSRPVAMQSNLHNALFIPADGVFHVANADHERPAAECGYERFDLKALLRSMKRQSPVAVIGIR